MLRSALEDRIKAKLEPDHPVIAWMCEYAFVLLNRFEVGKDGMTAFERNKRKKAKVVAWSLAMHCCGRGSHQEETSASCPACGTTACNWASSAHRERS